jgi:putative FmdB family regulatory protein
VPIYEYVCRACAYRFEVKQSIKDAPLTSCARCGDEVSKIISSPAIMFKGSGWYVTDYSDKLKPTGENSEAQAQKPAEKTAAEKAAQPATATSASSAASAPAAPKDTPSQAGSASSVPAATPPPTSG